MRERPSFKGRTLVKKYVLEQNSKFCFPALQTVQRIKVRQAKGIYKDSTDAHWRKTTVILQRQYNENSRQVKSQKKRDPYLKNLSKKIPLR